MRFVPVKSVLQQDIQALHRVRSELVKQRTAKGNQIRGLLAEYGLVVVKRIERLRIALPELLEDADNALTGEFRALLDGLRRDLVKLDERVGEMDRLVAQMCRGSASAKRLQQIPGIGPITASALIAAVGDGRGRSVRRLRHQAWARHGRLSGARAPSAFKRRQREIARHQQTWRQLPAHAVDSRRALGTTGLSEQDRPEESLVECRLNQTPQKCWSGCAGQQERADCLGGVVLGGGVPERGIPSRVGSGIRRSEHRPRVTHRSKRVPGVRGAAHLLPWITLALLMSHP